MASDELIQAARAFIQKKAGRVPAQIWTVGEFARMSEYMAEFTEERLALAESSLSSPPPKEKL